MRLGYQLHPNGEVLNGVLFSLGGLLLKQTCIQFPRIGVGKLFLQTFGIEQRRVVRFLQQSSSEILLAVLNELEDLHGNNTVALLSNHFAATVFVLLTLQNIGVGKLFLQTFGIEQRRVVRFLQQSSSEILLAVLNELEDLHGNNTVALLSNHFAATVLLPWRS